MLYVIATTFCHETSTPFPVSFQPMKLSSSLIVPFLCFCLFVSASLHFLLLFFFSFLFLSFFFCTLLENLTTILILQRRIKYLNVVVDF